MEISEFFCSDCKIRFWLWATIPTVQIVFGTFGNILNVIILSRKKMKKIPTSVFLMCLSVADMATLWTLPIPKMFRIVLDFDVRSYSEVLCRSSHLINNAAGGFSVWLLVILTMERMIMTRLPLHARNKFTSQKSTIIAVGTLITTILLSCHYGFGYKIQITSVDSSNGTTVQLSCQYLPRVSKFYKTTWRYAVLIVNIVIPAALIIVGNATILVSLLKQKKMFATVIPGGDCQRANSHRSSKETSATKLIFVISACFILTTLPQVTNRVLKPNRQPTDKAGEVRQLLLDDLLHMLFFCNFSINFLL